MAKSIKEPNWHSTPEKNNILNNSVNGLNSLLNAEEKGSKTQKTSQNLSKLKQRQKKIMK